MTIHTLVQPWEGYFGTKTDGKPVTFRQFGNEVQIVQQLCQAYMHMLRMSGYWVWVAGSCTVSRYLLVATLDHDLKLLVFKIRISDHPTNRTDFNFSVDVSGPYGWEKADLRLEVLWNSWRELAEGGGIEYLKMPVTNRDKSHYVPQGEIQFELLVEAGRWKEAEDRILAVAQEAVGPGRMNPLTWDQIELQFSIGQRVNGRIITAAAAGFVVDLNGVFAFLPVTQLDVRPVHDAGPLMGRELTFEVVKLDSRRENIVLSRRAILEVA